MLPLRETETAGRDVRGLWSATFEAVVEQLKASVRGSGRSIQIEPTLILEKPAHPAPVRPSREEYHALADRIPPALESEDCDTPRLKV
jgi:hypothetical protein